MRYHLIPLVAATLVDTTARGRDAEALGCIRVTDFAHS
jgi:hypothetical protein